MATRAKKAPAKTTKKPAASKKPAPKKTTKPAAKKSAAAKSATASASKKSNKTASKAKAASVSSASKVRSKRVLTPMERLRSFHVSTFISYVILAVATFFLVGKSTAEVILNYQARDAFTNADGVVLGSASEVLFSVDYRYILIAALLLGALGSLLLATKLRQRYEKSVSASVSGFRWLTTGISTSVILVLASFMAGVQDLMTLKVVAALGLLGALLGWMSERENRNSTTPRRFAYYGSIFAYLLALLPIAGSMLGTTLYGAERFGWHVYALAGLVLVGYVAVLVLQRSYIFNRAKYEYVVYETRYIRADQAVKLLAVLVLLLAIK